MTALLDLSVDLSAGAWSVPSFKVRVTWGVSFQCRYKNPVCLLCAGLKMQTPVGFQWLICKILAIQEAEIRRIIVWSQPGQIVLETLSWKYPTPKRAGGVAQVVENLPSKWSPEFKKANSCLWFLMIWMGIGYLRGWGLGTWILIQCASWV
jgi:hypothetical protein